jgi:hypothetical protein
LERIQAIIQPAKQWREADREGMRRKEGRKESMLWKPSKNLPRNLLPIPINNTQQVATIASFKVLLTRCFP